jgi:phosphoribosyl 1,2-cyclic phosphate phosphodiesterase
VPSFYCGCKACEEARDDPRAARDCSDLLVVGAQHTLIDAAPELRTQLIRERVGHIDRLLLTHEHFDHIGGIPQLEFLVRLGPRPPLPLYAGAQTLAAVERCFGFMSDVLEPHLLEAFATVEFDGVVYTPLPAAHSEGAFGFLIETAQKVAYFPDTGPLPPQTRERLDGLDVLIIDATFNGRNWMPSSHHTIDEAIALAHGLGVRHTYLTHLTMHYDEPITRAELEEKLGPYGGDIGLAFDGLRLTLG